LTAALDSDNRQEHLGLQSQCADVVSPAVVVSAAAVVLTLAGGHKFATTLLAATNVKNAVHKHANDDVVHRK